jgi:hypothetical protein
MLAAGGNGVFGAAACQAADLMAFNLGDANPVSVITEKVGLVGCLVDW